MAAGILATGVAAQTPLPKPKVTEIATDHLRIRYASDVTATADGSVSLVVEVAPRPGMHVYAPGATDYQVITMTLREPAAVRPKPLVYPPSEIYHFVPLDERIPVYQKPFVLTLGATVVKNAMPLSVAGHLEYQACDDRVCFSPVSVPMSWTVMSQQAG
jgi:DsbC/DsbD-like thiol-disulfide interchange protein